VVGGLGLLLLCGLQERFDNGVGGRYFVGTPEQLRAESASAYCLPLEYLE